MEYKNKPWAQMRMSRKQYCAARPWKAASMTRKQFEEIICSLPEEVLEELFFQADAELLLGEIFGRDNASA